MTAQTRARRAGVLVPLFSIASTRSWGIGEIGDLAPVTAWLRDARQGLLQVLPITETTPHDPSPYASLSAMAIDPQYITLDALDDWLAIGGERHLAPGERRTLERVRASATIDYRAVRALKQAALRAAFAHFLGGPWRTRSDRARRLEAYARANAWWLDDYALFRALHEHQDARPWMDWPAALRDREPAALAAVRTRLGDEILFRQYLQWVAGEQWAAARAQAGPVALFGDLPFMVGLDSADVWARQDEFEIDGSVGAPPDAFSADGQDWGLPPYRWDVVQARDYAWLRQRARRMRELFDGCRIDHVVGFYRTFVRPRGGGDGRFTPAEERAQQALGEQVLEALAAEGMEIVAEDLGTVPDFVRASLERLQVPGYKVLRWERRWHEPGQPFRDTAEYPAASVATTGTHDTEPIVIWWEQAGPDERRAVLEMPSVQALVAAEARAQAIESAALPPEIRDALIQALYRSGADLVIVPMADLFGWRERINRPATVGDQNWTWKLPWPVDRLPAEAAALGRRLQGWSETYAR